MKGKIVKVEELDEGTVNARIIFDNELEKRIDEREARWYDLEYIGESEKGNSIISFAVFRTQDEDEDDDGGASQLTWFCYWKHMSTRAIVCLSPSNKSFSTNNTMQMKG